VTSPAVGAPDEALRRAAAFVFVERLDDLRLEPPDAHHLLEVLRLGEGAVVVAADGAGRWCLAALAGARRRARRSEAARLEALGPVREAPRPPFAVGVGFALPKGDRAEWTVRKLTELGVDRIVPLLTERTVVALDAAARRRRGERLRRVAREAAAQARRPALPEVADPLPLADLLAEPPDGLVAADFGGGPPEPSARFAVVGPEGGFAPRELPATLARLGLGPTVLRCDTAALAAGVLLCARRTWGAGAELVGHAGVGAV